MPKVERPKLTNRGAAGLLGKKTGTVIPKEEVGDQPLAGPALWEVSEKDKIIGQLEILAVNIKSLNQDSENARLHPERNMASIKDSLCTYGQCKPIVVQRWSERKQTKNVIVAGNGTHAAATQLGWTKIAALITDMTDAQAAGYGLADNRTAELAKWDFKVMARLDKLLLDCGHATIGWSKDELEVLRMANWTPPVIEDTQFGKDGNGYNQVSFSDEQYDFLQKVVEHVRMVSGDETLSEGFCIVEVCLDYMNSIPNTHEVGVNGAASE
jgi:hypothetical protein